MGDHWPDVDTWGCIECGTVVEDPPEPATCPECDVLAVAEGSPMWEANDLLGGGD